MTRKYAGVARVHGEMLDDPELLDGLRGLIVAQVHDQVTEQGYSLDGTTTEYGLHPHIPGMDGACWGCYPPRGTWWAQLLIWLRLRQPPGPFAHDQLARVVVRWPS